MLSSADPTTRSLDLELDPSPQVSSRSFFALSEMVKRELLALTEMINRHLLALIGIVRRNLLDMVIARMEINRKNLLLVVFSL
jgi:hypothetical protein